ncbi:ATP-binding protein [Stenotrophomonas sp. NPDC077659]|uniref:ATP-binding protein n=1 Tax=Stenotrophomonas sp. NPDC077659 TaxID=3390694 RepID=UPI003CFE0A1F
MSSPDSVLATLRQLQRRLLFGGGTVLTVLLLAAGAAALWLRLETVHMDEREALQRGQQAVDRYIGERRRAYAASVNTNSTLWATQQPALVASGLPIAQRFAAQDGQVRVLATGALATPWLALSPRPMDLSAQEQAAYLGMVQTYSAYMAATVAAQDSPTSLISFAYEPRGRLFAIAGLREEAQLLDTLGVASREQALAALTRAADAGWHSTGATAELQLHNGRVRAYFGRNPFTGEDALVTQMRLDSGGMPFVNRLTFESLQGLRTRLEEAGPGRWVLRDRQGNDVLRIDPAGPLSDDRTFMVSAPLHGVAWTLLRTYRWADVWAAQRTALLGGGLALAALLAALWGLLLLVDRRVLRPALAQAARVHESEALSRTVIETSPVGLCLLDRHDGRLILHNQALAHLAGGPGGCVEAILDHLMQRGDGQQREHLFEVPSADPAQPARYLHSIVAAARYQERGVWVCAVTDVTAQQETQQRLREARQHAEQARHDAEAADHAKTAFVAMISHEIRTPLSGVLGHLELLAHPSMPAATQARVARARAAANVLQRLLNDTLDLSRIEAGLMVLEPEPFDPRALLQQTASLFGPQASGKGLHLAWQADDAVGPAYIADAHRLAQIINNLVGNAVKFTATGTVAIGVEADRRPDGQEWLRFTVRDTGPGIAADALADLFKPFVQVAEGTTRQHGGSGLGLALCQRFANLLGGTLGVDSTPGSGSVFHVEIPATPTTTLADVPLSTAPGAQASSAQGHALLVDDNIISREITQDQLQALGWQVTTAADGNQAWHCWRQGRFDIVLTDLNMPGLDGYQLARQIRAEAPAVPILAVTATAMTDDARRAREAGITTLLLKPVALASLQAALPSSGEPPGTMPITPPIIDATVRARMRAAFLQTARRDLTALTQALDRADRPSLIDLLHSFAGTLAMLGQAQAAQACTRAEQDLRSPEVAEATAMATVLDAIALITTSVERYEHGP